MATPLTIVICFDHAAITGGQAKVAFDSAVGLKQRGHHPIVFAAAGPVAPELIEAGSRPSARSKRPSGQSLPRGGRRAGHLERQGEQGARRAFGRLPRDRTIVHVHGWAKALSPSIAGPIRQSGLPAIYTIHEYFQFCPTAASTITRSTKSAG